MLSFTLRSMCVLVLAGFATACAPTYQLGMKPAQPTGLFAEGREQAQAVADSVEVRLNFVCYEPTRVVFEAEYRNPSHRSLLIDPAAFQYQATRLPAPALVAGQPHKRPKPLPGTEVTAAVAAASARQLVLPLPPHPVLAYDPEPQITALHDRAESETAKAERMDWFGLILDVASLATTVASIGSRETQSQFQSRVALQNMAVTYNAVSAATKIEHAVAAGELRQRAANLEEYALRKVTLAPGQQVHGYLYFPRYDDADNLLLLAPVGSSSAALEFAQIRKRTR